MRIFILIIFMLLISCNNTEKSKVLYGKDRNVKRPSQCSINGFTIEFIDEAYYVIYLNGSPATKNPFSSESAARRHITNLAGRHNDLWIKSNGQKYFDDTFFKDGRNKKEVE